MMWDVAVVDVLGAILIAWIAWYFWFSRGRGVEATKGSGVQTALVIVKGGYTPDTIIVEPNRPVRLVFRREEAASCSERVVLPAFDRSAVLPEGQEVAVEFVPTQRGEYPFACQMGMFRGRIVVN